MNLQKFDILVARYLIGELTQEDRLVLDQVIENDLFYFERFEQLKSAWEKSKSFAVFEEVEANVDNDLELVWNKINLKQHSKRFSIVREFVRHPYIAASITFILLLSSFALLYQNVPGWGRWISYSTKGQVEEVILSDNSVVILNEYSKIVYLKNLEAERKVRIKGEGYFKVAHDSSKPFIIDAGKAEVEVIGTEFNLRVDRIDRNTEIIVTDGVVKFSIKEQLYFIERGEQGICKDDSIVKRDTFNKNRLFWRTGVLAYSNSTLNDVVKELQASFKEIKSIQNNSTPTSVKITTRFENQALNDIFKELELHFGKKFALKNNILIISD